MPLNYDPATHNAAETWGAAGSRLRYRWGGISTIHPQERGRDQVYPVPTIIDYHDPLNRLSPDELAEAYAAPYHLMDGSGNTCPAVAYILVNDTYLLNGRFSAENPTSDQWDYESIILHELGHVAGLRDDVAGSASTTAMYPELNRGRIRRALGGRDLTHIRQKYPAQ